MAVTDLWDGKSISRDRFMSTTFTWDTDFPSGEKNIDQMFIKTAAPGVGIYRWDGTQWVNELFNEASAIDHIVALV